MDCEACNNLLLDYLYEELDEVRTAAVRRHLDSCAACTGAWDRLSRGRRAAQSLQLVKAPPPTAALLEAIQSAAKTMPATAPSGVSIAPVVPLEGARSRFPRWMRRAGEVAMRRQVAMAAVFLLMIGFGLSYNQFQSPTRPLPTSDEPAAEVIPATELPQPEATARPEPAQPGRRVASARGPVAERPIDHRAAQLAAPPARPAPAPQGPQPPTDQTLAAVQTGAQGYDTAYDRGAAIGRAANSVGSPAAYRNQAPPQTAAPSAVAANSRLTNDPALERGMPSLPLDNRDQANQAQFGGAANAQRAQSAASSTAPTWRSLQESGEAHRAHGESTQAVAAFQNALQRDPPDADRVVIARLLYETLLQSGRVREASEVQAQYLAQPSNATTLANEVHAAPASNSSIHPAAARPMPRAPSRMHRAPAGNDMMQNYGY